MTYILVFISNFLISVTRLLQEDLRWLRDYFSTLSSWNCLGFLLIMMIYVFLWRTILGFIAWGVRILLVKFGFIGKIEWLDKFLARAILKTPLYSNAYSAGYIAGETQRRIEEEEERKRREEEERKIREQEAEERKKREEELNKSWWQKLWPFGWGVSSKLCIRFFLRYFGKSIRIPHVEVA